MIRMSRSVSIFSVVVVMTITVLATVVVAFAQEDPLEEPENEGGGGPVGKVSVCHNTEHNPHTITVGAPAEAAHLAHGDTAGACAEDALEPGTPEPPEGTTLTTEATPTPTDGTISDTATLGADVQDGTDGDIEFKLYGPFTTAPTAATAATDCVAANLVDNPSYTSTVAVDDHTAGDTYPSATYTPTEPGIYQWTATFTPDAGQGDPTSEIGCGETVEQSVVSDEAATTGAEQNMTLAGEIGEVANLADPATDTTNIEGTNQNGNTTLDTDSVDDVLYGGSSANILLGRHGNDYLDGGKGRDRMVGGKQADHINGADGKPGDVINGGIGTDYCVGDVGDEIKNCDGNVVNVPLPSEAAAPAEARN
jgi:Ca2+-binding RTX toxin-like protein